MGDRCKLKYLKSLTLEEGRDLFYDATLDVAKTDLDGSFLVIGKDYTRYSIPAAVFIRHVCERAGFLRNDKEISIEGEEKMKGIDTELRCYVDDKTGKTSEQLFEASVMRNLMAALWNANPVSMTMNGESMEDFETAYKLMADETAKGYDKLGVEYTRYKREDLE